MVPTAGVGGDDGQLRRDADPCDPAGYICARKRHTDIYGDRDGAGDLQRDPLHSAPVVHHLPDGIYLGQPEKPEMNGKSILIKDTTREEREEIVRKALWGSCGAECEFCSGCDNRGGGRIEALYQPYIDGVKEIAEINAEYTAPFVR